MTDVLSRRALNRATLDRQLLLDRAVLPVPAAIHRLVALNAQDPHPPYLALWSRLAGFTQGALTELVYQRHVVRSPLLRATQHMVAADDYLWLRPLLHPVLVRSWKGAFSRHLNGLDPAVLASIAERQLRGEQLLTRSQLRDRLAERLPDRDRQALAWSVQALLPVIHPPPSGTWDRWGATSFTLAEDWLGRPLETSPRPEELIRRYLAAFGPATVKDMQAWSGLTRLREVVERMGAELVRFRTENGAQLFDISGAPHPDPETPAPVRLLPAFDNLMLAHADRGRVMTDDQRRRICVGSATAATVLVDGFVAGMWTLSRGAERATLQVEPLATLSRADRASVEDEAARLLAFAAPSMTHDVRFHGHRERRPASRSR